MTSSQTFDSVFDAIAATPAEAANLRARSDLAREITHIVKDNKEWTQEQAAQVCGISQPRLNDLLKGRISRFSLDALVNIASALGRRVHIELLAV